MVIKYVRDGDNINISWYAGAVLVARSGSLTHSKYLESRKRWQKWHEERESMKIQINQGVVCVTVDTGNATSTENGILKERCDRLEQENFNLKQTIRELREMLR